MASNTAFLEGEGTALSQMCRAWDAALQSNQSRGLQPSDGRSKVAGVSPAISRYLSTPRYNDPYLAGHSTSLKHRRLLLELDTIAQELPKAFVETIITDLPHAAANYEISSPSQEQTRSIGNSRMSGSQVEHSEDDTSYTRQEDGFFMSNQESDGSDVDTAPTTEDSGSLLSLGDPSLGTPPGQRSRHHGGTGAKETSLDLTVHRDNDISSNISHLKKVYTNELEGRARSAFVAQNTGESQAGNIKPRLSQTVQLGLMLAVLLPYLKRLSGEKQAYGPSRIRSEVMRTQDSTVLQKWFSTLGRHLHDGAAVGASVNIIDVQHFDLILPPLRKSVDDRATLATFAASLWKLGGGSCCRLDFSQAIDGISVNPQWGVTEAGKPSKRPAHACFTCREKKIRCDPGSNSSKCFQCLELNRECSFEQQQLSLSSLRSRSNSTSNSPANSPFQNIGVALNVISAGITANSTTGNVPSLSGRFISKFENGHAISDAARATSATPRYFPALDLWIESWQRSRPAGKETCKPSSGGNARRDGQNLSGTPSNTNSGVFRPALTHSDAAKALRAGVLGRLQRAAELGVPLFRCTICAAGEKDVDYRCIYYGTFAVDNLRINHIKPVHTGRSHVRRYSKLKGVTEEQRWRITFIADTTEGRSSWLDRHPRTPYPSPYFTIEEADRLWDKMVERETALTSQRGGDQPDTQFAAALDPQLQGIAASAVEMMGIEDTPRVVHVPELADQQTPPADCPLNDEPLPSATNPTPSHTESSSVEGTQSSPRDTYTSTNTSAPAPSSPPATADYNRIIVTACGCREGTPSYSEDAPVCNKCKEICTNPACRHHQFQGQCMQGIFKLEGAEVDFGTPFISIWFRLCRCSNHGLYCKTCRGYPPYHELVSKLRRDHGARITAC